jgi:hypothetical protein
LTRNPAAPARSARSTYWSALKVVSATTAGGSASLAIRRVAAANALANLVAFLPGILYVLPDWWQRNLVAYLPTQVASSLAGIVAGRSPPTCPLTAYAVIAPWAAAMVVAAGALLTRRNA